MQEKTLVVIIGPTGVGKTNLSLHLAQTLNTEIISCDSRQFYKELKIGTAAPTEEELQLVKHHFIGNLSIFDLYNAGQYELDAIAKLDELFKTHDQVLMVGGSMLYVDAVCNGIAETPTIDQEVREKLADRLKNEGEDSIRNELKIIDPNYYHLIDKKNIKRMVHALEVFYMTGKPFSSFHTNEKKQRPFNILKIGLNKEREILYNQINQRVDKMIEMGLLEEAKQFYAYKHLNTLNTVGYKEIYNYMDGKYDLDFAINMIKQNSRHYAKKQLSWFNRDNEIHWFNPENEDEIIAFVKANIKKL
ncbi:MAG: tRNA (adenosine(37)-N6)-dimethylallyltransferase MiaA [Paludibacteraceae bacterium]|nr:tRNA (adenosine(37)-N6)-dimethylallyltransferase MiaA [Paludibacteraceae bacterium]